MKPRSLSFLAIGLWVVTLAAFAMIMMRGNVVPSAGSRIAIELSAEHRQVVHQGMTNFFAVLTDLNQALSEGDLASVAPIAKRAGGDALAEIPTSLMTQLPAGFKQAGFTVHGQFDELAQRASAGQISTTEVQQVMTAIMKNCAACHGQYKIVEAQP